MAAITCTPTSPHARVDACRVDVTGADDNRAPDGTGGEYRYYLAFLLGGTEHGRSYVFNVSASGGHAFNSFIFEDDGSWTVNLCDAVGDGTIATLAVTVQA